MKIYVRKKPVDAGPAAADPTADDAIPAKKAKKPQSYNKKGQARYNEYSDAAKVGRKAALRDMNMDPKSLSPYPNPDYESDTEPEDEHEDEPTDAAAPPEPKDTFVAPLPGTSAPRTPRKSPRKQSTPQKKAPSTVPASPATPSPVRRRLSTDSDGSTGQEVPFTTEQEEDLAKWYEENPTLYNNSTATPQGRKEKSGLLARQAVKMDCTPTQIKEWMDKFRQYYVKLKRTKVGVPLKSLTVKQRNTLSRGTFLDPYIKQSTRSSGQDTDSDDSQVSQPASIHSPSSSTGIYVQPPMQDKTNPREGFQMFLGYKFTEVPDYLWYNFEQDCLNLVGRYREAGRQQLQMPLQVPPLSQQVQPQPQQLQPQPQPLQPQQLQPQQLQPQPQQLQPQPQQLQPQPQHLQQQPYVHCLSPTVLVQGTSPMKQQTQPQRSSAPSASGVFGQPPFQGSSFQ